MATMDVAAPLLASIAVLALSLSARAAQPFTGADGCAVLAQLVYSEVRVTARRSSSVVASSVHDAFRAEVSVCNRTAQTVSKAFALAMASTGTQVRWNYPSGGPGDCCRSGSLNQCYPQFTASGASNRTWDVVSNAVRHAIRGGPESDRSVFRYGAMQLALREALWRERRAYESARSVATSFSFLQSRIPSMPMPMPMNGELTSPGK